MLFISGNNLTCNWLCSTKETTPKASTGNMACKKELKNNKLQAINECFI